MKKFLLVLSFLALSSSAWATDNVLTDTFNRSYMQPITGSSPDYSKASSTWNDSSGNWWLTDTYTTPTFCLASSSNSSSKAMYIDLGSLTYPVTYSFSVYPFTPISDGQTFYHTIKFRMNSSSDYLEAGFKIERYFTTVPYGSNFRTSIVIRNQSGTVLASQVLEDAYLTATWCLSQFYILKVVDTGSNIKVYTTSSGSDSQIISNCTSERVSYDSTDKNANTQIGFYTNDNSTSNYAPLFNDLHVNDSYGAATATPTFTPTQTPQDTPTPTITPTATPTLTSTITMTCTMTPIVTPVFYDSFTDATGTSLFAHLEELPGNLSYTAPGSWVILNNHAREYLTADPYNAYISGLSLTFPVEYSCLLQVNWEPVNWSWKKRRECQDRNLGMSSAARSPAVCSTTRSLTTLK